MPTNMLTTQHLTTPNSIVCTQTDNTLHKKIYTIILVLKNLLKISKTSKWHYLLSYLHLS